jgi:hypothetical protein
VEALAATVRAGIRIHPDEPTDVMVTLELEAFAALTALLQHIETEGAKLAVLDGSACQEEQEAGNGPCGVCTRCLRTQVETLTRERDFRQGIIDAYDES